MKQTLLIRLAPDGQGAGLPQGIRDGIWDGICMDSLFRRYRRVRSRFRHIVLAGAAEAGQVDGFPEFLFDLLTNFPEVSRLTVELPNLTGTDANMLQVMLRQFCEVNPERVICLEMRALTAGTDQDAVVCDLWKLGGKP